MRKNKNINWGLLVTFILTCFLFVFIVFRLIGLQYDNESIVLTHDPFFRSIEAPRGNILSEDGRILSVTMPLYDVRLDLFVIDKDLFEDSVSYLSSSLHSLFPEKSVEEYRNLLLNNKHKRYFLLKRNVSYIQLQKMLNFPIFNQGKNRGGLIPELKSNRDYPFGSLAKITVGKVSVVRLNNGKDSLIPKNGIELAFNSYLQGIPGKQLSQEISDNILIPKESDKNILPKPGYDVVSSLNIEFQDAAEIALRKKLESTFALWGCAILMEVKTGKIKAIANLHRGKDSLYYDSKNHAILSHIEPGSTFKLASLMSLMEDKFFDLGDTIDTKNGVHRFYDQYMRDTKRGGYGKITLGDVFVYSSNVGISKAIYSKYKGDEMRFINNIRSYGLTSALEIQLPFQNNILVKDPENKKEWWGTTLPWMSIGYEVKLSPLHMLTFYNSIANKGKMISPLLVECIKDEDNIVKSFSSNVISEQICSQNTIDQLIPYMKYVVDYRTAKKITTDKYSIAGKTGTSEIEYWKGLPEKQKKYMASFVGFFPVETPKYSCIVVINNFQDTIGNYHYAGDVAAPVFKEISDKVFAFDSEMSYDSEEKEDNVYSSDLESDNVYDNTLLYDQKMHDLRSSLNNGFIPDFEGIFLMDLIYLLENHKVRFEWDGSGKVVSQSIKSGTKFNNKTKVKFNLSI